jgi:hypothetical protein
MADCETSQTIDLQSILLFIVLFFTIVLPCHALAALGFGDLYRFALKSSRLSSTKVMGSLLLCSESIRSSSRKHANYLGVARQFCVTTFGSVAREKDLGR